MKTEGRSRFFLAAHPLRALIETWLVGLLILFPLSRVVGQLPAAVFQNGLLMACGACGIWMVVRTRIPRYSFRVQALWELGVGIAMSVMMAAGLRFSVDLLGWSAVWQQMAFGSGITLILLMTGPSYLVARIGLRPVRYWNHMRRQRMLFSFTHAHLVVVLQVMAVFVILISIGIVLSENQWAGELENVSLAVSMTDRLFRTLFPLLGIAAVMMGVAVLALLPPSALVSYFLARRTTQRLERLAEATGAMRAGDYSARVDVMGEDEVAQLQADFNAMAAELEQTVQALAAERDTVSRLLASRRELLANVSHELRTPVTTVRATLESLLDGDGAPSTPALRRDLEVMGGEMLRLQGLIDDLFTLSQAEVAQLALECRPVDVPPVVRRMVEAMAPLAWSAGRVEVVAELPQALPRAHADESRLEQVLANLLRNGIRYTPPGGIVAVMAAAEGENWIRIEVRDTGAGIPPEELPHVWERFYRGDRARAEEHRGAGLGLALVQELTEAMGGSAAVESVVGEGSCFTLRLPQA